MHSSQLLVDIYVDEDSSVKTIKKTTKVILGNQWQLLLTTLILICDIYLK